MDRKENNSIENMLGGVTRVGNSFTHQVRVDTYSYKMCQEDELPDD